MKTYRLEVNDPQDRKQVEDFATRSRGGEIVVFGLVPALRLALYLRSTTGLVLRVVEA